MTTNLFIKSDLQSVLDAEFEKLAAEAQLPEDPNSWPQEILQELYKQVPYISDFAPHVKMQKVDAEKAYGFGYVEVNNQTEAQNSAAPQQLAAAGVRQVRIPVIVKQGKLQPFDLLVTDDSKVLPLTESRIRQAIFRPQTFDVTSQTPGDQSLIGALYPPYRQNYGMGGGGLVLDKTSSKQASVLELILPTVTQSDLDEFLKVARDPSVRAAYVQNEAAQEAVTLLLNHHPDQQQKLAQMLPGMIAPTVAQVVKVDDGYLLKTASHLCWAPVEQHIDRRELVERFGYKVALAADMSGGVTIGGQGVQGEELPSHMTSITRGGLYNVEDVEGRQLVGHVFVNLIDVDGHEVPLCLFTNGAVAAVQGDIVGQPAGEAKEPPTGEYPMGFGSFVDMTGDEPKATVPLDVQGSAEGADGEPATFRASTWDGREVVVSVQPNLQVVVGTEEGRMLIPSGWRWLPLERAGTTALKGAEDAQGVEKEAHRWYTTVRVRSGGPSSFSLEGAPVEKLAYSEREMIGLDQAMFLLAALGVDQEYGTRKLGEAVGTSRPVEVRVGRLLKTAHERVEQAKTAAAEFMVDLPRFKRQLFKEAALVADPVAVDTVLSLGFINPENVMAMVGYLPVLDTAQRRLCELLLAARSGLPTVSSSALERCVRALEEVLQGLKVLGFQGA
jgi:hypothetical protein